MESLLKNADITLPAAAIAIYLVVWITKNLEKKLDKIANNQVKTNQNLVKLTESLTKYLEAKK